MADITINAVQKGINNYEDNVLTQEVNEFAKEVKEKCFRNFKGRFICGYVDLERNFFLTWTRRNGLELAIETTENDDTKIYLKMEIRQTATETLRNQIKNNRSWLRAEEMATANMTIKQKITICLSQKDFSCNILPLNIC